MGLYPGSSNDYAGQATTYGPLPSHDRTAVALVYHTTETRGMPGFNHGDTAPHYVYDPRYRTWYVWAEWEAGYVGTLKGHSTGHYNCKAFQVEILAYSDQAAAASVGGIWVGDFTEDHYADLAEFLAWARDRYGVGGAVSATPAGGWLYGAGSPYRMAETDWYGFSGLTAHGAVPGNTHWDTGVLDLELINDLAGTPAYGGDEMYNEWAGGMFDHFSDLEITELYEAGYIGGNPDTYLAYWTGLRDSGVDGRTPGQAVEVGRFIQTSQVSAWLEAAK